MSIPSPVCKGGECAHWSKSTKFGTLINLDLLGSNLPGAKVNSQWFLPYWTIQNGRLPKTEMIISGQQIVATFFQGF